MAYRVIISDAAQKQLHALDGSIQKRIQKKGDAGYLRIRMGDYRIIYGVDRKEVVVLVVKIGHRREVYR